MIVFSIRCAPSIGERSLSASDRDHRTRAEKCGMLSYGGDLVRIRLVRTRVFGERCERRKESRDNKTWPAQRRRLLGPVSARSLPMSACPFPARIDTPGRAKSVPDA
eukprot:2605259-Rhodomonas_salina.1